MRLLPRLRTFVQISRQLTRIGDQLTRLADAAEGRTPLKLVDQAPDDPPAIEWTIQDDAYWARVEAVEGYLTRILQRQPTPDEIVHELDGLPRDPSESAAALKQKLRVQ